jgi:hypothetical protein
MTNPFFLLFGCFILYKKYSKNKNISIVFNLIGIYNSPLLYTFFNSYYVIDTFYNFYLECKDSYNKIDFFKEN